MPAEDITFDQDGPQQMVDQKPSGLHVTFYKNNKVRDEAASKREGRPIHLSVDFVRIMVLGDKSNIVDRPVRPEDKHRFRAQWLAYEAGSEQVIGQPLSDWPGIPQNVAEDFIAQGLKTVEQLSEIPDGNLHNLGPLARRYRDKAAAYIQAAKMDAPLIGMQEELEKERAARARLEQRLADLEAGSEAKPAKRRPGRPRRKSQPEEMTNG